MHGSMKVSSDHSMDWCPISTQGTIHEAIERTNTRILSQKRFQPFCSGLVAAADLAKDFLIDGRRSTIGGLRLGG